MHHTYDRSVSTKDTFFTNINYVFAAKRITIYYGLRELVPHAQYNAAKQETPGPRDFYTWEKKNASEKNKGSFTTDTDFWGLDNGSSTY